MPTLLACLSSGKGTWTEVNRIIASQPWSQVFLVTNSFGQENYKKEKDFIQLIVVDFSQETSNIAEQIRRQLQGKISDFEVALNFSSGIGREHMALLEAVLELGLNFRLIVAENNRVDTLGIKR
jgi:phosphopantothenoylcysteine synthetase/decarboxylase